MDAALEQDRDRNDSTVTPDEARADRIRRLAWLLDQSIRIPGTEVRIGLDALIGLVPVVGDAAGAVLATYIIGQAARLGAAKATIARMIANVGVEAVVGLVPLAGDLFDVGWRANVKNVRLLEDHLEAPERVTLGSRIRVVAVAMAVICLAAATTAIGIYAGVAVMRALF